MEKETGWVGLSAIRSCLHLYVFWKVSFSTWCPRDVKRCEWKARKWVKVERGDFLILSLPTFSYNEFPPLSLSLWMQLWLYIPHSALFHSLPLPHPHPWFFSFEAFISVSGESEGKRKASTAAASFLSPSLRDLKEESNDKILHVFSNFFFFTLFSNPVK